MLQDPSALDRYLIRELVEKYSYAVNARDYETLADCFTEKGVWDVGPPFNFRAEGRENLSAMIAASINENEYVLQMPHATMIWLEGERARAHTTMQELVRGAKGNPGIQLLGIYHDSIVRDAGKWRFEKREFRAINVLMENPQGNFFGSK
jgi:ketosteroid isomerase-like protein